MAADGCNTDLDMARLPRGIMFPRVRHHNHEDTTIRKELEDDDLSWTSILSDDDYFLEEDVDQVIGNGSVEEAVPGAAASAKTRAGTNRRSVASLNSRWKRLKEHYAARDEALKHLSRSKSHRIVTFLYEREHRVREQQREQLLMELLLNRQSLVTNGQSRNYKKKVKFSGGIDELGQLDSLMRELSKPTQQYGTNFQTAPTNSTWLRAITDSIIFETSVTLPAIISLLVHTLVHASVYEIIQYVVHEARKALSDSDNYLVEGYISSVLMILGLVLLRLSGYLYWWCNRADYQSVKFDFHNRQQLGLWDAQCMLWVKHREKLRAVCYILGYDLLYCGVLYIQTRLLWLFFDQRKELLASLPSRMYDLHVTMIDASSYSFACQQQVETMAEQRDELRDADIAHTW